MTIEFAEIGPQKIAYHFAGPKQKTVVFIHGNSSCKDAFQLQFEALNNAGYGVLAMDLPGHGDSSDAEAPQTDYTIPSYAILIRELCAKLGIKAPLLCGWSLGGHIAIEMAGTHDDYAGLLIFGTPPVGPGLDHMLDAFLPSDVGDVTGAEAPPKDRIEAYIRAVYGSLDPVPNALRAAGFRADGLSRSKMFEHWASGQSGHNQRDVVLSWSKPLLILQGADDAFVSTAYLTDLEKIKGGHPMVQILEGTGHAPFLEKPDAFNRVLLSFCQRSFG